MRHLLTALLLAGLAAPLAAEIRRGQAVILEEVPLFDRALDAIVERLKAAHTAVDSATE